MAQSAIAAVRNGSWREVSGGPLAVAAAVAVAGDAATTARILSAPEYWEGNRLLAGLAAVDPAVAIGVFVTYSACFLAVAWLSVGWLSPAAGGLLVVSMGGAAASNLLLFATGTSAYARLGVDHVVAIHFLQPLFGVCLGVAVARSHGPLPTREVAAVLVAVGAVGAVEVLF